MAAPKILAFSGSARSESFNQQLVHVAAKGATAVGAEVTIINLADFALPIFDQDLEAEGTPENAQKLKQLFVDHDGLLIACPEYNSSITPLLKNAIDWVSRPAEGEPPMIAYRGKAAAILAASPGALGGLRGLNHVRSILTNIGVIVVPNQVAVPAVHEKLIAGEMVDERMKGKVEGLGSELAGLIDKLTG